MTSYIDRENLNSIVAYDLDDTWLDYLSILLQYIKKRMVSDINGICNMYTLSDDMVEDVLLSSSLGEDND